MDIMNNKTAQLKSHLHQYVKTHVAYDLLDRVEYVYTAANEAAHGAPCVITRYAYVGNTTRVAYMREYEGTWDVAWEAF